MSSCSPLSIASETREKTSDIAPRRSALTWINKEQINIEAIISNKEIQIDKPLFFLKFDLASNKLFILPPHHIQEIS